MIMLLLIFVIWWLCFKSTYTVITFVLFCFTSTPCLSSSLLPSFIIICYYDYYYYDYYLSSYTWQRQFSVESFCVSFIVPCISSYRWVHFPRSVLFCQPHQLFFTHSFNSFCSSGLNWSKWLRYLGYKNQQFLCVKSWVKWLLYFSNRSPQPSVSVRQDMKSSASILKTWGQQFIFVKIGSKRLLYVKNWSQQFRLVMN